MPYTVTEYDNGFITELGAFKDMFSVSEEIKYKYDICIVPIYGPELRLKYNYFAYNEGCLLKKILDFGVIMG